MRPAIELGELEQLVLLAVLRLGPAACGVPVLEDIQKRTSRRMSRGAVYITLRRLERKGLLKSHLGEPAGGRGGRAKRYFQVERPAVKLLKDSRKGLVEMWRGLEGALDH